jgi:SAM-dependent methyltransferase
LAGINLHISVFEFFVDSTEADEFNSKRVLEIGSKYVNGSVRTFIEKSYSPEKYTGADIESGKCVDVILSAEKIAVHFGSESFDVVVTTEMLEHVMDWRAAIENMKVVTKCGGYIYVTTRSKGFAYHGYPYDFWRYEIEDIEMMFADFEIITLKKDPDPEAPGIFLKARKRENWLPEDLSDIALYSMILGKRTRIIPKIEDMSFDRKLMVKLWDSKVRWLLPQYLLNRFQKLYLL